MSYFEAKQQHQNNVINTINEINKLQQRYPKQHDKAERIYKYKLDDNNIRAVENRFIELYAKLDREYWMMLFFMAAAQPKDVEINFNENNSIAMGLGSAVGKDESLNKNIVINRIYSAFYKIRENRVLSYAKHHEIDGLINLFKNEVF